MADEIELKLELSSDGVSALMASALFPPEATTQQQRSIYFDTLDHHLAKAGLSLRIRRAGRKRMQTVKAEGGKAAGLFARPEWELPVRDDTPILDDSVPIRAMIGDAVDEIVPIFEVQVERLSGILKDRDTIVEIVLDRGEVVAGERRSPICEIELELKAGEPAVLFELARRIDAMAPVHIGAISKGERGYRLFDAAPHAIKAGPVELTPVMNVARTFQEILNSCLRHFRLNEALLLQTRQSGPLHQARVALRRLRSALAIFKPVTATPEGDRLREELRWLAGELGDARNLDVLLQRVEAGQLHDRLRDAREGAYDKVQEVLASQRSRALMLDLVQWTVMGDWLEVPETAAGRSGAAREFASAALDRFRRQVKKKGRDLVAADAEHRHDVRKSAKKLRYAAEFFASLYDRKREKRRYKKFIDALEDLQDVLGKLNDVATAAEVLAQLDLAHEPHAAALLTGGREAKLIGKAADAHEDFADAKRYWR